MPLIGQYLWSKVRFLTHVTRFSCFCDLTCVSYDAILSIGRYLSIV